MPTAFQSKVSHSKEKFQKNKNAFEDVLKLYSERLTLVAERKSESSVKNHKSKGKLLVRERIEKLVDSDTFLELSSLAAFGIKENSFPSAGIITGLGKIRGVETVIIANDATVKGGTYIAQTIKKHLRALEIALHNLLPCVYLVDSGGVFLPDQAEVFADKDHFGRFFYYQSRISSLSVPQISIVMGSCTAGGAYVPAMSDEVIMVKKQGTIFIGGPPLVKAATGEDVTAEELGGAEMHTMVSGVADYLADSDEQALEICRDRFEHIKQEDYSQHKPYKEPIYDIEDVTGIISTDLRVGFDMREVIARIVDESRFQEFKERYGPTLVTCFAKVKGIDVGIIGNNGILFSEAALKGTHFIELCTSRKIPIFFLHNVTGFMVGKRYENSGLAKDGAKMIHAVANACVPKISLVVGGSFGAGNYAMCGRGYDPNFMFTWPNAKVSVMGGEQAASVLVSVKKGQVGKEQENKPADLENLRQKILEKYEEEGSAYYGTARIWDDGIIHPFETREVLARALQACLHQPIQDSKFGVFRM
ncbi:carboxyl transferase domain-containing protein [Reichenbachiella versicolor]|uniref:carboxyl transferase domain-containing protein n=1 Tax=Reichenbachiella versicolor TaxID=1821036 RepID=UPI000D6DE7B8|nr:carboxyl transferase domain-containing protein [Reichenbachiella versicolor]